MSEENKEQIEGLDEFHYHEALDRSYIVGNMIEDLLTEHPVIQKHAVLKERIEKAQELIVEAYQIIGGLSITEFSNQSESADNK